jgi:tetratricopeptide (TPR) repeat protein
LQFQLHYHPDAGTFAELGKWYGERNQYDCAAEAFRESLKLQPDSAEISYLLGLSVFSSGNARDAVFPLQKSIQLASSTLKPHLLLAAVYEQLREWDKEGAEYAAVLRMDPHSMTALRGLTKILVANNNYLAVISLLKNAPMDEPLTVSLARAYGKAHMFDQAAQLLVPALRKYPGSLNLTSALISVYVNQTRNQDAEQLAAKSALTHPGSVEAQSLYLHLLILNHSLDRARPLAKKLLATHPHDFEVLYLNGVLERDARQYDVARQHLEEAVALSPTHFNARYNLGIVLSELQDFPGARLQLEKSLALGAGVSEPQVRYRLGSVLRSLGKADEAKEQFKITQAELQETSNKTLAAGKSLEAEAALKSGETQKAIDSYRQALEVTPKDPLLNFKLAMLLDSTDNTAEEEALLQHAIESDPAFALAQNQLGYLESREGDFASAEQHFRLAVQSAPGYAEAWVNLSAALGMESRFVEALKAVTSALKIDPKNSQALQLRQSLNRAVAQH